MAFSLNNYHYKAFGLSIDSEIEFNELIPISIDTTTVDVNITERKIAASPPKENSDQEFYWCASDNYFFMVIKGLAKFEVTQGNKIEIEKEKNADFNLIRLFILGTCFGIVCHQKGLLPIHGCAIATDFGCKIFAGPMGVGKSTLAAGFVENGYEILADDVSVISLSTSHPPRVFPSYPQIKICPDSAARLNIKTEKLIPIDLEKTKFRYPVTEHHRKNPMDVSAIYFLNTHEEGRFSIDCLEGAMKFIHLKGNTYREAFIDAIKVNSSHFKLCAHLADQIPMYTVKRPVDQFYIHELVQHLEKHFLAISPHNSTL